MSYLTVTILNQLLFSFLCMWRNMTVLGKHQHVWSVLHRLFTMSDNHRCISVCFCSQVVSSQGVAAEETSEASAGAAATHTHTLTSSSWLEHTSLCWRQAAKGSSPLSLSALVGCRGTLGTSPRTLIQTHKKELLLSTAAQAGFFFLMCSLFSFF